MTAIFSSFIHYSYITLEILHQNNDFQNFTKWSELLLEIKVFSTYILKVIYNFKNIYNFI
jgi:hypothetical protein